jgi:CRP/FNR family cyclic AMP-dependent transcriptional regulator
VLRAGHWFASLAAPLASDLLANATVKALAPNERLFARGDAPNGLFAIAEGALRITGLGPDGEEAMLTLAEPPAWFGEISVFDGLPRTHDAIAATHSIIIHLEDRALRAVLARHVSAWFDLGRLVANKLRLSFAVIEEMAILPLPVVLARRLLLIAQRHGEWQDKSSRIIELNQEQLALILATTRQTVNLLLKDLEASGAVRCAYGTVEIVDLARLRSAAKLS